MYFCWFKGASPCNLFGFLEWFLVTLSWLFLFEILFWFHVYVYISCWAPLSVLCLFSDVYLPFQVLHIPQFSEINSIHGESWVVFRMSISGEVTDSLPGTWNVICEATCNAGLLWLAIHLSWIGAALWLALAWSHDLNWNFLWGHFTFNTHRWNIFILNFKYCFVFVFCCVAAHTSLSLKFKFLA